MLRGRSDARLDRIRNEDIQERFGIVAITDKLCESRLL